MTRVGVTHGQDVGVPVLRQTLSYQNATERNVSTCDAFGKGNEVRFYVKSFGCECAARATKARHDFIKNQNNAVLCRNLPHTRQIAFWVNNHAVRTNNRLENNGGDFLGIFKHQGPLEMI